MTKYSIASSFLLPTVAAAVTKHFQNKQLPHSILVGPCGPDIALDARGRMIGWNDQENLSSFFPKNHSL